jgi:hypothetical protein
MLRVLVDFISEKVLRDTDLRCQRPICNSPFPPVRRQYGTTASSVDAAGLTTCATDPSAYDTNKNNNYPVLQTHARR